MQGGWPTWPCPPTADGSPLAVGSQEQLLASISGGWWPRPPHLQLGPVGLALRRLRHSEHAARRTDLPLPVTVTPALVDPRGGDPCGHMVGAGRGARAHPHPQIPSQPRGTFQQGSQQGPPHGPQVSPTLLDSRARLCLLGLSRQFTERSAYPLLRNKLPQTRRR